MSACLAVAYADKAGQLVLGIYDVLRVRGADKGALGVFERQGELFALFQAADALCDVKLHWIGEEHSLAAFLQSPDSLAGLPFVADHMLRLEAEASEEYELLLRALATYFPAATEARCR